jgi:acyl-CoA thioester hydrolase
MASYPLSVMEMKVTWGDCDAAGISYYARTFDWFTNARMKHLADYGLPYMNTFHSSGIAIVCLKADCEYKNMVRPEEEIMVHTRLTLLTRTRMTYRYQIFKQDGILVAEGETRHACVDLTGNPFNLKRRHPQLWQQLIDKWPVFEEPGGQAE